MKVSSFLKFNENIEVSPLIKNIIEVLSIAKKPLTVSEIISQIPSGLTRAKVPRNSISTRLNEYTNNSKQKGKNKKCIFTIVNTNPLHFWLIDRIDELNIKNNNIQDVPDEDEIQDVPDVDMNYMEIESEDGIKPFTRMFPSNFKATQAQSEKESEDGIKLFPRMFPSNFKASQAQSENKENPFRQAICVLGKSGAGKSYTVDEILENSDHEYEFIIPSASTTGLLSQFSPSAKDGRGGYIPSRLGKMIEKAYKNNNTLYTVVFDECHKSNIIEMINDELLQAISTGRNKNRFISLDDETSDLYPSKILDKRGNIEITDNLGFIFISSNARVISGNEDFFNRVDLVELTKESRESVKTIEDLNRLRISDTDKKYELVSKIMSESKR